MVRSEWSALIARNDLRAVDEDAWSVTLHNEKLGVVVIRDRGELTVSAFLLDGGEPACGWTYSGMIGKASEARLLQIAADRITDDPRVLAGDAELFEQIAVERRRLAREWTDFYARKGPRPATGRLP